jgi:DNA-directed RNA polymerase I subunit RPA2
MYVTMKGGKAKAKPYKFTEPGYVDEIRVLDNGTAMSQKGEITQASMKIRFERNPVIGDKFSSRHGQKVCWYNMKV